MHATAQGPTSMHCGGEGSCFAVQTCTDPPHAGGTHHHCMRACDCMCSGILSRAREPRILGMHAAVTGLLQGVDARSLQMLLANVRAGEG